MISGQNNGKTHTKQIQKGWEFDFPGALSSTQQHSAALSSQSATNFQVSWLFAGSGVKKLRTKPKKTQNPSKKLEKQWTLDKTKEKHRQKKREKGWELDFPAALSSAQQHSAVLNLQQFQGFLTFCRVRVEKVRTKPKKAQNPSTKLEKQWNLDKTKEKHRQKKGKRMGIGFPSSTQQHSAALSNTQQHSAALSSAQSATNFKVSWLFAGSGVKKVRTKPKKSAKSIKTMGKHTQNKWKKAWNWISQQHSAAHSAALSSTQQCSICNQFQGFLTFSRVRDEKGENEAKKKCQIHSNNLEKTMKSGQNNGKTHTKQIQKGWELDFPAALSSTQQHSAALSSTQHCSICNQFQGFLTFSRVRDEKGENEAKKNAKSIKQFGKNNEIWTKQWENTHKTNGKRLGIGFPSSTQQHSAALSSTQQHSAALRRTQQHSAALSQSATNFKVSWIFCRVRGEKGENEAKKKRKIHQKHTQNKWKKAWNWISQQHSAAHSAALSSTQQHSAVLNLQPISRFPDFLQGQGWKGENEAKKKAQNPSNKLEKQWTLDKTKEKHRQKKREKGWELDFPAALSSTQQHSAALSSAQSATNFKVSWLFAGPGVKRWERSQKITQNQSKKLEKQCENTHTQKTNGKRHGIVFLTIFKVFWLFAGSGVKKVRTKPKKKTKSIKNWGKTMISGQNNGKNNGHAIEMPFFCRSKKNKLRMMAKRMMAKNDQNHQKLWQKPWKLQQNKWKKAGDCISQQCSAVLNLQLISKFPDFLQVRVKGVRTKPTNKTYGKTMKSGQSNGKKPAKQMEKGLGLYVSPISKFPDFLQGQGGKGENEAKKITQSPSTITEKTMKHVQNNGKKTRKNIWKKAGNCISQHCSAVLNLELISRFPDFLQGHCERSEDDKPHQRLWLKIYENLAKQLEKHGEWHWIAVLFAGLRWETLNPG